jgi:hypothetical protein
MKTLKTKISFKNIVATSITTLFTTLFVWWGLHFPAAIPPSAKADTFAVDCSPTPSPTPIMDGTPLPSLTCSPGPTVYPTNHPELEILLPQYQNPNGAKMAWIQYGGDVNNPKPGVLVIHGSGWNGGSAADNLGQTRDIANAGFFAASVFYELGPNDDTAEGYIPDQPCHEGDGTTAGWRMNQQVNDIKNAVKAMRADERCTGWVAVVGGSAGATHAITVALDTNPSPNNGNEWPRWFQGGHDDRPDCAVMLSAVYDFSDWTPPTGQTQTDPDFVHRGLNNYAQTLNLTTLKNLPLNPVNLVPGAIARGFKPIYMINSYIDHPSAYHQLVTMVCLLLNSGLTRYTDFDYLTIPGSAGHLHSFQYWDSWDHLPSLYQHTVGDDVINFLQTKAALP